MKLLALLVIIIAIALLVWIVAVIAKAIRARAPWEIEEQSDGEAVKVLAVHSNEEPLLIGYVPFGAVDFDSRLYEIRAEGREKVYALNQRS